MSTTELTQRHRDVIEELTKTAAWIPLCELVDLVAHARGHGNQIPHTIERPGPDDFLRALAALRSTGDDGPLLALARQIHGLWRACQPDEQPAGN